MTMNDDWKGEHLIRAIPRDTLARPFNGANFQKAPGKRVPHNGTCTTIGCGARIHITSRSGLCKGCSQKRRFAILRAERQTKGDA